MNLVWKLLRQHISIPQFSGFFIANLVGMVIILLGVQFYADVQALYDGEDSFMRSDYLIVNKKVGAMTTIMGKSGSFSEDEIEDIKKQSFVEKVGMFASSSFDVKASFDIQEFVGFSTDMFFESVPDDFIDVVAENWHFSGGEKHIPIILPRNYLDLYNFGYAQSRSLPKLSEGILGAMKLKITVSGNGKQDIYDGDIVGFSSRLNTILVPWDFMEWANKEYGKSATVSPTRMIVEVNNPTDEKITSYLQEHNYVTDQDKLDASKTSFVLRVIVGIVMSVGFVISILAFYILMLSVYLLVQKNTSKLENLLLVGYSPAKVSMPYQMLTVGLNVLVFLFAFVIVICVRNLYVGMFRSFFMDFNQPSMWATVVVGVLLLLAVSVSNVIAVRRKVMSVWKGKNL
ncbi:MAG: ABC transporter permease [Prevotellaceae bacterium]|nr:ABC transporter permease [Prevotellaceae bacterium]